MNSIAFGHHGSGIARIVLERESAQYFKSCIHYVYMDSNDCA